MASRASLNKVLLIGNLTRDPELRYTPSGAAVCTFSVATNRVYVASDGTKKEEAEFIRIVSWNKLAELCSKLLTKGRKVYVDGRLQTRSWETPDGQNRQTTEVVIDDMRILDSRRDQEGTPYSEAAIAPEDIKLEEEKGTKALKVEKMPASQDTSKGERLPKSQTKKAEKEETSTKDVDSGDLEDLPF